MKKEMKGLGFIVIAAFVILTVAVCMTQCPWNGDCDEKKRMDFMKSRRSEGFQSERTKTIAEEGSPIPYLQPIPPPTVLTDPSPYVEVNQLPSAPVNTLAETNSRPFEEPKEEKTNYKALLELKTDMDGFSKNEAPYLKDRSDPAVQVPMTRFVGDYTRVKDEVMVVEGNPGLQPNMTIQDIDAAAANLRFLQRTYRLYSENEMVPATNQKLSSIGTGNDAHGGMGNAYGTPIEEGFQVAHDPCGVLRDACESVGHGFTFCDDEMNRCKEYLENITKKSTLEIPDDFEVEGAPEHLLKEGFEDTPSKEGPVSPEQLEVLQEKIGVEILRLQASGTTDPVSTARVNIFTKIEQAVNDYIAAIKKGTMKPSDIPIQLSDYNKFLPVLGDKSVGPGGLISRSQYNSLSSLFNAYDRGDLQGADLASRIMDMYLKGLSFKVEFTGDNEVKKEQAKADMYKAKLALEGSNLRGEGTPSSFSTLFESPSKGASFTKQGSFDMTINALQAKEGFAQGFPNTQSEYQEYQEYQRPPNSRIPNYPFDPANPRPHVPTGSDGNPGVFDWKTRADSICKNIVKTGLDPKDYACFDDKVVVSKEYGWRGHTKMVCNRLKTHIDPGIPEQMGCPPAYWRGWQRS